MGFWTTLIILLLGFIAEILRRIHATVFNLEMQIDSLQTQLAILEKGQKCAEADKEHAKNELEELRTQLERWRERDQEEKLTLIGSINKVSEQIENDRQRAMEAQYKSAGEEAVKRVEKAMAHRKSKVVKKHMSTGGLNIDEAREWRRRELEVNVHPALRARSTKPDSGYEQMDGVDSDVETEAGYMGGSDLNTASGEGGESSESRNRRYLLNGRSLKSRQGRMFC